MKNIFRSMIAVLLVTAGLFVANGIAQADAQQDIQKYTAQIAQNPNDDYAYNNRGMAFLYLGQYEYAIQDFNKAISLNPYDELYYNNRGDTYNYLKQYNLAI